MQIETLYRISKFSSESRQQENVLDHENINGDAKLDLDVYISVTGFRYVNR